MTKKVENKQFKSELTIQKIGGRKFLQIGEQDCEIDDYKIVSSGNGYTTLTIMIKENSAVFGVIAD